MREGEILRKYLTPVLQWNHFKSFIYQLFGIACERDVKLNKNVLGGGQFQALL